MILVLASAIGATLAPAFDSLCSIALLGFESLKAAIKMLSQIFSGDLAGALETAKGFFSTFADTVSTIFANTCEAIKAFFTTLWQGVAAAFPDFAGWAENAANAIKSFFSSAIDWVRDKFKALASFLPDFLKDKLGLSGESKQSSPLAASSGAGFASLPQGAALTPTPMQAQAAVNKSTAVNVESKTEITVNGAQSPEAVAGKVAQAQNATAADIARNTQGGVR